MRARATADDFPRAPGRLRFEGGDYKPRDQDGEILCVFADDDEVLTWAVLPGYLGDPCHYTGQAPSVVRREEARIRLRDSGETVLEDQPYYVLQKP